MSGKPIKGYDDSKPDSDHEDRGRTYCGYEEDVLENRARDRYLFCLNYIKEGDICLDAACGSGYGTEMISHKAAKVYGVEVSDHALTYAREHHNNPKIKYLDADITSRIDFPDNYFDVVTSVETIEHIEAQDAMLTEFQRVLKPGGVIIITTVDHYIYNIKGGIRNKYHIGELTKQELLDLVAKYFRLEELYGQVKYQPLESSKKVQKSLYGSVAAVVRFVDVFNIRLKVLKMLGVFEPAKNMGASFGTMVETGVEKSSLIDENVYYQLLLVASKRPKGE